MVSEEHFFRRMRIIKILSGIMVFSLSHLNAQFKTIHGTLGGEYEQQDYFYSNTNIYNHYYRQLAQLGIDGNLYNNNLGEFNIQTRILNSNGLLYNAGIKSKQHNTFLSYYDITLNLLKKTRFPIFIFLRRDINSIETSSEILSSITNKVLSTAGGFRISSNANGYMRGILPQTTLSYDQYHSEGINGFLLEQMNRNIQISFNKEIKKTNLMLDLMQRDRYDKYIGYNYRAREIRFRSVSQPNEVNQISINSNFFKEAGINQINVNAFWNSKIKPTLNNQFNSQFMSFWTSSSNRIEGSIRDNADLELSPEWRGLFIFSQSVGRSVSQVQRIPIHSTSLTGGFVYRGEFEKFRPTINTQFGYDYNRSFELQRIIHSVLSAGVQSKGFSFSEISLSNQININHSLGILRQTELRNLTTTTIETNAIPALSLRSSAAYGTARNLTGDGTIRRKDFTYIFNATYRIFYKIDLLLNFNFNYDWFRTYDYTNRIRRYMIEMILPEVINNLSFQGSITKTQNTFWQKSEYAYNASIRYNWRAIIISFKWTSFLLTNLRRNDVFVNISRPFNISLK